jgi:hypothetical protein
MSCYLYLYGILPNTFCTTARHTLSFLGKWGTCLVRHGKVRGGILGLRCIIPHYIETKFEAPNSIQLIVQQIDREGTSGSTYYISDEHPHTTLVMSSHTQLQVHKKHRHNTIVISSTRSELAVAALVPIRTGEARKRARDLDPLGTWTCGCVEHGVGGRRVTHGEVAQGPLPRLHHHMCVVAGPGASTLQTPWSRRRCRHSRTAWP